MDLEYKLEYLKGATEASDEGVFFQIRTEPLAYQSLIAKEDYLQLDSDEQSAFVTGLFNVAGVVRLASQSYRIYIEKSPAFQWPEVLTDVLDYLVDQFGADKAKELPGSPITLTGKTDRRPLQ